MVSGAPVPGLYVGTIRHRRRSGIGHSFTYPLFMAFLDVSRIEPLMAVSRFTSYNGWNWASFHECDHFGDPARPLRERLENDAARHGHALPDGPVFVLTHLRYLGYCFNPVSFFYCYDQHGVLRLILAEVKNTFGGSWNYWLVPRQRKPGVPRHEAAAEKAFYVSPFMPPDVHYSFTFTEPGERLVVHISADGRETGATGRALLDATLMLHHRPWTSADIRRTLLRHPLMTARVIGAIHWEALKLWSKGIPHYSRIREGV